jgi:hypothetical protein
MRTGVYKEVYAINGEGEDLKRLVKDLKASSKSFDKRIH